jgi:hypothetical protein
MFPLVIIDIIIKYYGDKLPGGLCPEICDTIYFKSWLFMYKTCSIRRYIDYYFDDQQDKIKDETVDELEDERVDEMEDETVDETVDEMEDIFFFQDLFLQYVYDDSEYEEELQCIIRSAISVSKSLSSLEINQVCEYKRNVSYINYIVTIIDIINNRSELDVLVLNTIPILVCDICSICGHLDIFNRVWNIQYHKRQDPYNFKFYYLAAKHNKLNIIQYITQELEDENLDAIIIMYCTAAINGHVDIIDYFSDNENYNEYTYNALYSCISNNKIETAISLIRNKNVQLDDSIMYSACYYEHFIIVQELLFKNTLFTNDCIKIAFIKNKHDIVKLLLDSILKDINGCLEFTYKK